MANLVTKCPSCGKGMKVSSVACSECNIRIDGDFNLPHLLTLSHEDQEFVFNFFKAQGVIKEMEKIYGVSYQTIKNRWSQIAKALNMDVSEDPLQTRMQILESLKAGEISADEAAKKLKGFREFH